MVKLSACCLVLGSLLVSVASALGGSTLSSPMVDASLYRDGEVKRLSGVFGDWRIVCDEIAKLRQRYCSLKTTIQQGRRVVGLLDMSTGDDGQPVALLHLPLGVLTRPGIEVGFAEEPPVRKAAGRSVAKAPPPPPRRLAVITCDARECLALWNLNAAELGKLQQDKPIAVHYRMARLRPPGPVSLDPLDQPVEISGAVSSLGFTAALKASLQ